MTIAELQIQFDLNPDHRVDVLRNADTCRWARYGYLFVDQDDGQCYLFDKNGCLDDICKVRRIRICEVENCLSLVKIEIPNSVKIIDSWAFYLCTSLTSIEIPDSVKDIGACAFYNCTSLASIKIPNSVKSIGDWAFMCCPSLKKVVFEGKTMKQVKAMYGYPWGIKDISVIKTES